LHVESEVLETKDEALGGFLLPAGVGAQWELPGGCGAWNQSLSASFSLRPRYFDPAP